MWLLAWVMRRLERKLERSGYVSPELTEWEQTQEDALLGAAVQGFKDGRLRPIVKYINHRKKD